VQLGGDDSEPVALRRLLGEGAGSRRAAVGQIASGGELMVTPVAEALAAAALVTGRAAKQRHGDEFPERRHGELDVGHFRCDDLPTISPSSMPRSSRTWMRRFRAGVVVLVRHGTPSDPFEVRRRLVLSNRADLLLPRCPRLDRPMITLGRGYAALRLYVKLDLRRSLRADHWQPMQNGQAMGFCADNDQSSQSKENRGESRHASSMGKHRGRQREDCDGDAGLRPQHGAGR
jgi:hypothetical protein